MNVRTLYRTVPLFLVCWLLATAGAAYVYQYWWPDGDDIVMDDALLPSEVWSDPAQLQMSEWNEVDTLDNSHPFQINTEPELSFGSDDGDNTIGFLGEQGLMNEYGLSYSNALAWTQCWVTGGGDYEECDVMLDPDLSWSLDPHDSTWFQSTVLHELGHVRGLDHYDNYLSMQNSGTSKFLRAETNYMDDKVAVRQNASHVAEVDLAMYPKWHDGSLPQWMSFGPNPAREGETVQIQNLTVENRGTAAIPSNLGFGIYLSPDASISSTDDLLSSGSWSSFGTFMFDTFNWSVQVPQVDDCRSRYLGGIVDPTDDWPERFEGNNAVVFADGTAPYDGSGNFDPTPLEILLARDVEEPNDTLGTAAVLPLPYFRRDLSLDSDEDRDFYGLDVPETGTLFVEVSFQHAAGDVDVEILDGAGDRIASSTTNGDVETIEVHLTDVAYFVHVYGDGAGSCNEYQMHLTFDPDMPDLVPTQLAPPVAADPGETIPVQTTVANQGLLASGSFDLDVYVATDDACSPADVFGATRTVATLGPGESSSAEMAVTIPNGMPLGPAYLCLIADVPGSVVESDETNNRKLAMIEIGDPIFVDGFESGDLTMWTNVIP